MLFVGWNGHEVVDCVIQIGKTKSVVLRLHVIFRAMSYTIFRCKVSDSGARQGHTPVLLEKKKNKFGEGFP